MTEPAKPLVWVTGAQGLVGYNLLQIAAGPQFPFHALGLARERIDLSDFAAVRQLFHAAAPQAIIHCAAISKSAECEAQPDRARRVNTEIPAFLADLARNIPFVFISSDLVYDGQGEVYDESTPPNPVSLYGETKLAAEQRILPNPRHIVIRTSLNGGISPTGDRGFNQQMRLDWRAGKTPTFFTDEYRCPIAVTLTARALWELTAQACGMAWPHQANPPVMPNPPGGLYLLAGRQYLSRWEIAQCVAARCRELNPQFVAETLAHYHGPPRPPRLRLHCAKVQARLSFPLLGLKEWLEANPDAPF
jgi:dTDP-4-dehydrorhamnose reductase